LELDAKTVVGIELLVESDSVVDSDLLFDTGLVLEFKLLVKIELVTDNGLGVGDNVVVELVRTEEDGTVDVNTELDIATELFVDAETETVFELDINEEGDEILVEDKFPDVKRKFL
jgi:hypothetical protein